MNSNLSSNVSKNIIELGKDGTTPLMRAAAIKKDDPIELIRLINDPVQKSTIFDRDAKGKTALDWARISNNFLGVRLLLDAMNTEIHNARIDSIAPPDQLHRFLLSTNSFQSAQLIASVQERQSEVAEDILRNNRLSRQEIEALGQRFFTDAKNRVGYTPLMLAAGMNMKDVVRELVLLKAPINDQNQFGQTALTIACATGNADIVQFLLVNGADVQHRTSEGRTVLHYACMYAKAKLVKIILNFLIERFAIFRIEGHKLVEFDFTRWTTYSSIITNFIKARDNNGKRAIDLLPDKLENKYQIEKRLKLSGVTGLDRLSRKPIDKWSVGSDSGRLQNMGDDFDDLDDEYQQHQQHFIHLNNYNKTNAKQCAVTAINENLAATQLSQRFQIPLRKQYGDEEDVVDPDVDSVVSEVTDSTQFSFFDFSHNTDNDIVPSVIGDAYSAHTAMPLEKELEYIRSCFDKVEQKVLQWQNNAEKEKELAQVMACPLECGAMCRVEDMTTHVRDQCPLRTLQCPTCHLIILQKDITVHATRLCGKRTIACPNAYAGCNCLITPDSKDLHLRTKCEYRQVPCRQFCNAVVAWKDLDRHEAEFCRNRSIKCDQCQQSMTAQEYPSHLLEQCPERLVTCQIGCGQKFKAKDLTAHEEHVCQGYCKWACGQKIGPPAKLQLHEAVECLNRPVTCCLNCHVPKLTVRNKAHHEKYQCQLRLMPCSYGCGEEIPLKYMRRHQQMFTGTCTRRPVYCPSNLVGWRVKLVQRNVDALVLKYERKKLPSEATRYVSTMNSATGLIAESEQTMPYRTEITFGDYLYVRSPKGQLWINVWTTDFILLEKAIGGQLDKSLHRDCHFTCGKFLFLDLTNHLYIECPNRKVAITGEVDRAKSNIGQVVSLAEAVQTTQLRLDYDDFEEREKVNDDGSQGINNVTCSYCAKTVPRIEYEMHCVKECSEYHIFCPYGCGKYLPNRDVDAHCKEDCPKRSVTCPDCLFSDLWAEELEMHQREKCPKRIVTCAFVCGIETLCACDKQKHEEEICDLRNVMCSCGLLFQAKDLDDHMRLNCINRQVFCPQGCGESMKQCDVDQHIEFFCRNKTHYFNQTIECGNGCGCVLMRRDLLHHVSFDCTKRLVECSQNCGNTVPLDNLKSHLKVCPQRIFCCEPGMTMCAKPLHEWFYKIPVEEVDDNTYHNVALAHLKKKKNPIQDADHQQQTKTINQLDLFGNDIADDLSVGNYSLSSFDEEHFKQHRKNAFQQARSKLRGAFQNKMREIEKKKRNINSDGLSAIEEDENTDVEDGQHNPAAISEDISEDEENEERENDPHKLFKEKKEKLFEGNSVKISFIIEAPKLPGLPASVMNATNGNDKSTGTKSIFDMLVVSRNKNKRNEGNSGSSIGGHSSVYYDGPAMKFREDMRLHFCTRHRVHAIIAAIRYQEYDVLEFIARQVKQSSDIDVENVHGDTALTLACRMGNLPFVQILITHGADVNKETFNGRTALIEAVKCDIENIPLIEYLINEGALIKYKTARHGKTSLDWARRYAYQEAQELREKAAITGEKIEITKERMRILGRPHTVRLLELAAIVQQQANMMFQKIAIGDNKWVLRVIQEGDFFDPNNEKIAYVEMEKFAAKAEEADRHLADVQAKTFGLSEAIDQLSAQREHVLREIVKSEKIVKQAYEKEKSLDSTISAEFAAYEKIATQMKLVDLEEMVRLQKPSDALLTALFATGYLFDLYDESIQAQLAKSLALKSMNNIAVVDVNDSQISIPTLSLSFILESKPIWFPILLRFLKSNMREALRRLQTFSRGKIHLDRSQQLFAKVMELVNVFKILAYQTSAKVASSANISTKTATEAALAKARREGKTRQRQMNTSNRSVSPNNATTSPSPFSASGRKRITFSPDATLTMSVLPNPADINNNNETNESKVSKDLEEEDIKISLGVISDFIDQQNAPSLFSPWQETGLSETQKLALRNMRDTNTGDDNFWSGIDKDIIDVPYIDAVQAEEDAKDQKRRDAYKAWLNYQLASSGKKKTPGNSLTSSLQLNASLTSSIRGRTVSPPRLTTTIVDGKPVIFKGDTMLSGQEDNTDNDEKEVDANEEMDEGEWDSDAEGADTGKWEKGEWVPIERRKKTWWNPTALAEELKLEADEKAKKKSFEEKQTWQNAKIIRISDNWLEEETKRTIQDLKNQQKMPEDYEEMLLKSIRDKQLAAAAEAEAEAEAKRAAARGRSLRSSMTMNNGKIKSSMIASDRSPSRSKSFTNMNISGLDALPNTPFVAGETAGAFDEEGGADEDMRGAITTPPPGSSPLRDRRKSRSRQSSSFSPGSPSSRDEYFEDDMDQETVLSSPYNTASGVSSRRGSPSQRHHKSRSSSRSKKRRHRRKSTMMGDDLLDYDILAQLSKDDFVGYPFVAAIDRLLRAITRFALNYKDVLVYKQGTLQAIRNVEALKQEATDLSDKYKERYEYRAQVEKDYIQAMKTAKFFQDKVLAFKEKVRVARLMNTVSVNGHTPISWAAAYGNFEVVEEMLSRGGMVGFNAQLYHMTATYLQMSYQIFLVSYRARNKQAEDARIRRDKAQGLLPKDVPLVAGAKGNSKAQQMELMKQLTILKDKRAKLLDHLKYLRSKMRFPVPEAVYTGRWEIVKRIYERRLLQPYFLNTWTYPSPPPSYRRRLEMQYEHRKYSILEILTHGMNDLAAGIYLPDSGGWVGANDPREPYGEMYMEIHRIVQMLKERKYNFLQGRHRIRILANERRNQREGEKAMISAILRHDFVTCMQLAQDRGITIDLETADGQTALIAASEEDPDAMNHEYMVNVDGRKCLAVEFLLDRIYYRPGINLETTKGYTALIRASMLGRAHVVSALLDRGADINYQNTKQGRTALHYAAACGHEAVTRILVERLADVSIKDFNGQTAYDIAEGENFIHLMSVLSQYRSGNLGSVQLTRGYVNNQTLCPLGCGLVMYPFDIPVHVETCLLRIVSCPLGCSLRTLAREIDEHLISECPKRLITCQECNQEAKIVAEELPQHLHDDCVMRTVPCPLHCGKEMIFLDVDLHTKRHCGQRLVHCPNQCPEDMNIPFVDLSEHLENLCINRRVPCPNKCHSMVIFHRLEEHLRDVCSLRHVHCQYCAIEVPFEAKERHETQQCPRRPMLCPWKCGQFVPAEDMDKHRLEECGKSAIDCPLQCGRKIYRQALQKHVDQECPQRVIPCPNQCIEVITDDNKSDKSLSNGKDAVNVDGMTSETHPKGMPSTGYHERIRCIPAKLMEYHVKYDCPHRPMRCSLCQNMTTAHSLNQHQAEDCMKRMVHCRNVGCQKTLPFDQREEHEIRLCRFRMSLCPQGCGELVMTLHMTNHCARQCLMRYVDACPLQCTLLLPLRAKDVEYHLAFECPRRHLNNGSNNGNSSVTSRPNSQSSSLLSSTSAKSNKNSLNAKGDVTSSVAATASVHQLLAATSPPLLSRQQLNQQHQHLLQTAVLTSVTRPNSTQLQQQQQMSQSLPSALSAGTTVVSVDSSPSTAIKKKKEF